MRLFIFRGPGPDFSERDRAVLTPLRPHLHQAFLDAERRRHPVLRLTPPGNGSCRACWQLGTPTRTSPADSAFPREQCVLTWKTSTNGWTSPAAPPRSPAPSPTGSPSAHRPGEGGLSRSRPGLPCSCCLARYPVRAGVAGAQPRRRALHGGTPPSPEGIPANVSAPMAGRTPSYARPPQRRVRVRKAEHIGGSRSLRRRSVSLLRIG